MTEPLTLPFSVAVAAFAAARLRLREWLVEGGVRLEIADDLVVVANEFMLRALRTGAVTARLRAELEVPNVVITVEVDQPSARGVAPLLLPGAESIGQRIVEALCDDVEMQEQPALLIRCRRAL